VGDGAEVQPQPGLLAAILGAGYKTLWIIDMFLALSLSTLMVISDLGGAVLLGTNVPANSANTSHQQINCIMQQTQQPYKLLPMPWRRAKQEVKMGRIDGYFTAIPNEDMNEHAKLSAPLFLENWYWFWHPRHSGPDSGGKVRYGAILGSHQADWFTSQNYKLEVEVSDIAQLVQLLAIGRIDAVLADLEEFTHTASRLKLPADQFEQRFFRYVPLGVYFSQLRLQQKPGFMRHFNAAVHLCASAPFALAQSEQQQILTLLLSNAQQLARSDTLLEAVQQQNLAATTMAEIRRQDTLWQQQLLQGQNDGSLAYKLLETKASAQLRNWQANYSGLVTEVILMDNQGANVAISEITTDYWQGDETPFLSVFGQQSDYFIDVVEYDQSTRRFQVKLSVPVADAQGRHSGALSIGIDVERALSANN
jgi:hypothetical protein